ncbi:MAG: hypothetical protein GY952_07115 [Rhodobacteraceae bacterium]|nr:hypothetical protein [Paracoccaceae bacterium]
MIWGFFNVRYSLAAPQHQTVNKAGVAKSTLGLRKSRGIELAEAGLSARGMMSWLGHQALKEAQHYTEEVDRWRAVMGPKEELLLQLNELCVATAKKWLINYNDFRELVADRGALELSVQSIVYKT